MNTVTIMAVVLAGFIWVAIEQHLWIRDLQKEMSEVLGGMGAGG